MLEAVVLAGARKVFVAWAAGIFDLRVVASPHARCGWHAPCSEREAGEASMQRMDDMDMYTHEVARPMQASSQPVASAP